jgi:hypothetical protein
MSPGVRRRDWVITKELLFFYIEQVDSSDECYVIKGILWGRWEKIRGGAAV